MTKIYIETLGCPKNWVESESILGKLNNISLVTDPYEAETIIINTCSFLNESRKEAIDIILQLAQLKKKGKCTNLVVAGCLVESHESELTKELHEVDLFCTPERVGELINLIHPNEKLSYHNNKLKSISEASNNRRFLLQTHGSNYLKIAEGCNHSCTFCTIPQFKGRLKSRSVEELVSEAKYIISNGISEINLVA
ncbi:MAG: radical SAM protein, partial [Spirochaetota bacterium]|nr:radical SAM protein [Spirochaetota bacterium]